MKKSTFLLLALLCFGFVLVANAQGNSKVAIKSKESITLYNPKSRTFVVPKPNTFPIQIEHKLASIDDQDIIWIKEYVLVEGEYYERFKHQKQQLYLGSQKVEGKQQTRLLSESSGTEILWETSLQRDGNYKIMNLESGLFLGLYNRGDRYGSKTFLTDNNPEQVPAVEDIAINWRLKPLIIPNTTGNSFNMIIASDPQSFRVSDRENIRGENKNFNKEIHIELMGDVIKALKEESQANKGYIINGDLTEQGNTGERNYWKNNVLNPLRQRNWVYPGLGNHDIKNSIEAKEKDIFKGCPFNECAQLWMKYMRKYVKSNRSNFYDREDIHYAFREGNYVFVQLNVAPFYGRDFNYGVILSEKMTIPTGWDFLKRVEAKARKENLRVVVNFHAFNPEVDEKMGWTTDNLNYFQDLVRKSNIVAVFVGHIHERLGRLNENTSSNNGSESHYVLAQNRYGQEVNIIYSGALLLGSYLRVTFTDFEIIVNPVLINSSRYPTKKFDALELKPFSIYPNTPD